MTISSSSLATPTVQSRLPQVGTTIFTVMSALAQQTGAVNLGQGFPDFACDPALLGQVGAAMAEGLNQYPPSAGAMPLRQAQSDKVARLYGRHYDPDLHRAAFALPPWLRALLSEVVGGGAHP